MARHEIPQKSTARRVLVALATAGMALGAGATNAAAADAEPADHPVSLGRTDPQAGFQALRHATGPVTGLKPNPLAGTGVDPLDNGVGTQVADFKPVTSRDLTGPVAQAPSVGSVPGVGGVGEPSTRR
ncbi:hypothetical protein [Streptomyces sp. KR55]|uniref:hypothetical protein n=1 Tax=Streptomyces sp. KR55 TaxID=3457425 RepID=UPI003FD67529